jgi:hypothetical protein
MRSQGLLADLRTARENPGVALFGAMLGGLPPTIAWLLTHYALPSLWAAGPGGWERWLFYALLPVVAACLAFSVSTVWQWGSRAFHDRFKASCLVVALEGSMVLSPIPALSAVALAYLVVINAIATACTLVAEDRSVATPAPSPTVDTEAVARELGLTRRGAAKVVARQARPSRQEQPA